MYNICTAMQRFYIYYGLIAKIRPHEAGYRVILTIRYRIYDRADFERYNPWRLLGRPFEVYGEWEVERSFIIDPPTKPKQKK